MVKREHLVDHLKACGWEADQYGHLQCTRRVRAKPKVQGEAPRYVDRRFRVHIGPRAVRIEVRAGNAWVRIGGDWYGNCKMPETGLLVIGSYTFRPNGHKIDKEKPV